MYKLDTGRDEIIARLIIDSNNKKKAEHFVKFSNGELLNLLARNNYNRGYSDGHFDGYDRCAEGGEWD